MTPHQLLDFIQHFGASLSAKSAKNHSKKLGILCFFKLFESDLLHLLCFVNFFSQLLLEGVVLVKL